MPLTKSKPQLHHASTCPELTRQDSLDSVRSPITPAHDASIHPAIKIGSPNDSQTPSDQTSKDKTVQGYPFPTPINTQQPHFEMTVSESTPITTTNNDKVPSKDLAFLKSDPYADDDIIPFDKNKPIVPSRHGSVRSIMSTSSMQSLKRGIGTIKRSISRSRSKSRARRAEKKEQADKERAGHLTVGEDGVTPVVRAGTFMMSNPKRVDTYQVSGMAF